jgi:uncharacterized protein (TIGR02217 family)
MRFPEFINVGCEGGPDFLSDIITNKGGYEKRIPYWSSPIYGFIVSHDLQDDQSMDALEDFFKQGMGNIYPFRFKWWRDYYVSKEDSLIVRTDTATLKLHKIYPNYNKRITKVVPGTFKLYANGVLVQLGFSLDTETGIVTLQTPSNYPSNTVFTFECEFDFWVRFVNQGMRTRIDSYNNNSWTQIEMVEVRERL